MQCCNGYCDFLETLVSNIKCGFWDRPMASRCTICEKRMITPENKCPCCHSLLRKNPHGTREKERIRNV
jgi:hypothetical protein